MSDAVAFQMLKHGKETALQYAKVFMLKYGCIVSSSNESKDVEQVMSSAIHDYEQAMVLLYELDPQDKKKPAKVEQRNKTLRQAVGHREFWKKESEGIV